MVQLSALALWVELVLLIIVSKGFRYTYCLKSDKKNMKKIIDVPLH